MPQRYFENTIWTNHALERLSDRRLSQQMAWKAFQYPDSQRQNSDGSHEYVKRFGIHKVTVIAKQNERHEWVIISCWLDPPLKGTKDEEKRLRYIKYKNAGFFAKFFMHIKRQLFNQDF